MPVGSKVFAEKQLFKLFTEKKGSPIRKRNVVAQKNTAIVSVIRSVIKQFIEGKSWPDTELGKSESLS